MKQLLLTLLAATTLCPIALAQTPHVDPATPTTPLTPLTLSIGGRVLTQPDATDPAFGAKLYTYQWPGTYFDAAFRGSELYLRIVSGQQHLHITIDHDQPLILTRPAPGIYRLSGLTPAAHTVRLAVVSESQSSPNSFGGFALPPTGSPATLPTHPRQIEFIGDSHTVGYGNTSPGRKCTPDQVWYFTDNTSAFGPLTAAHYNADYQINAISGHGIVRNYNGSPGDPVPVAYPFVLFDKKSPYTDPTWQPQVIVLALGTNDFSTPLNPNNPNDKWKTRDDLHADYEATYVRFLQSLRAQHPKAFFIVWSTGEPGGEIETEASKVVQKAKSTGETRIAFLPINGLHMDGCDFHPSTADDLTISQKLIDLIDATPAIW
jgi:lysophospholipase L1-like esterase